MKKIVAFTLYFLLILKWDECLSVQLPFELLVQIPIQLLLELEANLLDQNVNELEYELHSPSKCLVWVKKCCHLCLDQNFDPSLLTSKLWLVFMGKKQKKNFFSEKKIQNGRLKKTTFFKITNFQKIFMKISQIGPWVSRIDWCEGH